MTAGVREIKPLYSVKPTCMGFHNSVGVRKDGFPIISFLGISQGLPGFSRCATNVFTSDLIVVTSTKRRIIVTRRRGGAHVKTTTTVVVRTY